ncbi:RNA pseudouridylate synthase domain-containing protein 1 [Quaeritorhiza haematococci]|nr:RNA pseudouridylate synthase domain-containing protein 1 [Quaeritorhiza haematococci]
MELPTIKSFDPTHERDISMEVIYYDKESYLIVNKPYDIRVDGDTTNSPTVESLLQENFPQHTKLYLIHQLDFVTSGVHCWGLSKKAARDAGRSFMRRKTKKTYLAVVRGHLTGGSFDIDKNVAEVPDNDKEMCVGTPENPGKSAQTTVTPLRCGFHMNQPATIVQLEPLTGRRHQLRVHMASIGYPIIGDYVYEKPEFTKTFRTMLHAWKLDLPLPTHTIELRTENPFEKLVVDLDAPMRDLRICEGPGEEREKDKKVDGKEEQKERRGQREEEKDHVCGTGEGPGEEGENDMKADGKEDEKQEREDGRKEKEGAC